MTSVIGPGSGCRDHRRERRLRCRRPKGRGEGVVRIDISQLRSLGDRPVRVSLVDGSEHSGRLRTELLSESAIAVFLDDGAEGATLYIDQISSVAPASGSPGK